MYINQLYSLSFLVITILTTYFCLKRSGKKGCITFVYFGLVIGSINLFTFFSWVFVSSTAKDIYAISSSGEKYMGTVVSFTEEEHYDSDENRYYTMLKPTVQFTTKAGALIEKELNFSTSSLQIGDTYKVNYNATNGKIITLGFTLIISIVAAFIFCFIFTFLFSGIIRYAIGFDMKGYYTIASKAGFNFFIPFLMIGFNALLIYAVFYGNTVPIWVTCLLLFFSLMLALGTWGYLKMIFLKGSPKMKRVSANKWVGGWKNKD